MQIDSVRVSLPLKRKFAVSKGETDIKTNFLTILNNRYNGEAAGSVHAGPSVDQMEKDIRIGIERLRSGGGITVDTLSDVARYPIDPTARSALVGMVLNFLSGESRRYPWEILSLGTPVGIKSSITISIDEPGRMIEQIKQCEYPIIKIKMGQEQDVLLLDALDAIQAKEIRVDANGSWSCAKAEEMIFHLGRKGVTIIEQPTDVEYVQEWSHLKRKDQSIHLIMDEGLNTIDDYRRHADFIDGVNIKMEKCGGIIEALRIAGKARADSKKVMLGCMVETSIGIAQSVYMSSLADYFDLDGPLLLERDIARGIRYNKESIEVDREIIGGPKLRREIVEKFIDK